MASFLTDNLPWQRNTVTSNTPTADTFVSTTMLPFGEDSLEQHAFNISQQLKRGTHGPFPAYRYDQNQPTVYPGVNMRNIAKPDSVVLIQAEDNPIRFNPNVAKNINSILTPDITPLQQRLVAPVHVTASFEEPQVKIAQEPRTVSWDKMNVNKTYRVVPSQQAAGEFNDLGSSFIWGSHGPANMQPNCSQWRSPEIQLATPCAPVDVRIKPPCERVNTNSWERTMFPKGAGNAQGIHEKLFVVLGACVPEPVLLEVREAISGIDNVTVYRKDMGKILYVRHGGFEEYDEKALRYLKLISKNHMDFRTMRSYEDNVKMPWMEDLANPMGRGPSRSNFDGTSYNNNVGYYNPTRYIPKDQNVQQTMHFNSTAMDRNELMDNIASIL